MSGKSGLLLCTLLACVLPVSMHTRSVMYTCISCPHPVVHSGAIHEVAFSQGAYVIACAQYICLAEVLFEYVLLCMLHLFVRFYLRLFLQRLSSEVVLLFVHLAHLSSTTLPHPPPPPRLSAQMVS